MDILPFLKLQIMKGSIEDCIIAFLHLMVKDNI